MKIYSIQDNIQSHWHHIKITKYAKKEEILTNNELKYCPIVK